MLATIILDTFKKDEAGEIAVALEVLCSPKDHYAFSSACIYSFWSVPKRQILYIGLAKDITQRFQQHANLVACDPACCKSEQIKEYFSKKERLGYSIIAQSALCHPLTKEDEKTIAESLDDDAFTTDVSDVFEARENIAIAEGMLIELFEQLGDRLPSWNKIRGSVRGRDCRSLFTLADQMKFVQGLLVGKSREEIKDEIEAKGPPYELLLNLEGSELSDLNARSTLREVANNATVCEHELFLHGVRMGIVSHKCDFDQAVTTQLVLNEFAQGHIDQMKSDGYWNRELSIPGL